MLHIAYPCSYSKSDKGCNIYPKGVFTLKPYETLFFTEGDIDEKLLEALINKVETSITKHGGQIEKVDKWGKRALAYPVEKHTEGYYVHIDFQATPEALKELERTYLINQTILRFMTTKRPN